MKYTPSNKHFSYVFRFHNVSSVEKVSTCLYHVKTCYVLIHGKRISSTNTEISRYGIAFSSVRYIGM